MLPTVENRIYVISGVFAVAVFVFAVGLAIGRTTIGLTTGTLLTLTVGFFAFIGVYFVAMAVYRGIERNEREK